MSKLLKKYIVKKFEEIAFVNSREILRIIYISDTGGTIPKWRRIRNSVKVMGEVSNKALINLVGSGVLSTSRIVQYRGYQDISQKKISQENKRKNETN